MKVLISSHRIIERTAVRALVVLGLSLFITMETLAQTPTALPLPPGFTDSGAEDINVRGVVVGEVFGGGKRRAVRWELDGSVTFLRLLPGDTKSQVFAVNQRGEATGSSAGAPGVDFRAMKWDRHGAVMHLTSPREGYTCIGFDINKRGEVAGRCNLGGRFIAVYWSKEGVPSELDPLPPYLAAEATAINAEGVIVGRSQNIIGDPNATLQPTGTLWLLDGTPVALPPVPDLSNTSSIAHDINSDGLVVGTQDIGPQQAITWDEDNLPTPLDPLVADSDTFAYAVSANGEVAGSSSKNGAQVGLLWDRSGTPILLPPLSRHTRSAAWGINDRGVVVGTSSSGDQSEKRAVVWK